MTPNQEYEFATVQFQTLSDITDKPYEGTWQRKKSVRDYIAQYADSSMASSLNSIPRMQSEIVELSDKIGKYASSLKTSNRIIGAISFFAVIITLIALAVAGHGIWYQTKIRSEFNNISQDNIKIEYRLQNIDDQISKLNPKTSDLKNLRDWSENR